MIKLFTDEEYNNAKGIDKLPFKCENCGKTFYVEKKMVKYTITHNINGCRFCSIQCANERNKKGIITHCENCGKEIRITPRIFLESKSKHFFCSKSCAAKYNNTHKTVGVRRSKMEYFLEKKLSEEYPQLEILYNNKTIIGSELDIYIPKYKIAFELNGIFHYEPIFGEKKFNNIVANDKNKFLMCQQKNISLCVIDTSQITYFKEEKAKKYYGIIKKILDEAINNDASPKIVTD